MKSKNLIFHQVQNIKMQIKQGKPQLTQDSTTKLETLTISEEMSEFLEQIENHPILSRSILDQ